MDKVAKSTKAARGTVTCDNTTMHLLKANDFVGGKTTLLQETARRIGDKVKMKILVGDLETERDRLK